MNTNKISQQTQDLLETISVTTDCLHGNVKYISDLCVKLRTEIMLTLGAIERAVHICSDESVSIAKTNKQLISNLAKGV